MAAIQLSKTLQDKLIKTVTYLESHTLGINGITSYKFKNHFKLNFSNEKVVSF